MNTQVFDDKNSVSEGESAQIAVEGEPAGRPIDKGFLRNIKIIGIFLLVVFVLAGYVVYHSFSQSPVEVKQSAVNLNSGAIQSQTAEQTPEAQRMVEERQRQEAEDARKRGVSYIPPDPAGKLETVAPPAPTLPPSSMQSATSNFVEPPGTYGSNSPANESALRERRDAMRRQLDVIYPKTVDAQATRQSVSWKPEGEAGSGETRVAQAQKLSMDPAGSSATSSSQTRAGTGKTIVSGLEIVMGRLANPIAVTKGRTAYASAVVTSGPLAGAFMTGQARLNDEDTIEIAFTKMRVGSSTYTIDAIVLDEQTADAGVAGEIDRRLLQRYVFPVALAAAQGFFQASAQTGNQVISATGGVLATQTPVPTTEQARNAGIAAGLGVAQRDVMQRAQTPIRGSVERNMTVGILFREAVKETAQ